MLELIGLDKLFRLLGNVWLLAGLGLAALVAWRLRGWPYKLAGAAVVIGLFAWYPVNWKLEQYTTAKAFAARRAVAAARMEELCKSAGEFIHRTAEGVDGIFLMKLRPTDYSEKNQWAIDPYGWGGDDTSIGHDIKDRVPESYVRRFLRARDESGAFIQGTRYNDGSYDYVDLIDPVDGQRYRYTGWVGFPPRLEKERGRHSPDYRDFYMVREPVTPDMPLPRYGVTFDDITEHEDRARWWIAGSSLRVIDLEAGEVMAERIGYLIDPYIGEGGSYTNWTTIRHWGRACPRKPESAKYFVRQVLIPEGEDQ